MFARQQWEEITGSVPSPSDCNWVVRLQFNMQTFQDCNISWNYRASPSRCWQHPCAHRVLLQHIIAPWWLLKFCRHRTDIARCLHKTDTIPAQRHLPSPSPAISKKCFNSALDCLRSPQQLSQLPPCCSRALYDQAIPNCIFVSRRVGFSGLHCKKINK
jgi:hypothetical protein